MPSINMIAARRAEKRRQEQNIRKLAYGILAEAGVLVVAVGLLGTAFVRLNNQSADLGGQIRKLQPKVTAIQKMQQDTGRLQPKVQTLEGAKQDTLFWYSNLYAVTNSLPPQTWLTTLGTGGGTGGAVPGAAAGSDPTFSLTGVALTQAQVGDAMLRMNRSPRLDRIELAFVQQQKTGATDTVSFQMTVHLKPEPSAAPAGAPAQGGASNVQKS